MEIADVLEAYFSFKNWSYRVKIALPKRATQPSHSSGGGFVNTQLYDICWCFICNLGSIMLEYKPWISASSGTSKNSPSFLVLATLPTASSPHNFPVSYLTCDAPTHARRVYSFMSFGFVLVLVQVCVSLASNSRPLGPAPKTLSRSYVYSWSAYIHSIYRAPSNFLHLPRCAVSSPVVQFVFHVAMIKFIHLTSH